MIMIDKFFQANGAAAVKVIDLTEQGQVGDVSAAMKRTAEEAKIGDVSSAKKGRTVSLAKVKNGA